VNPYILVITSDQGSTIVPLGEPEAQGWMERYKDRIKAPRVAELRPKEDGQWPLLRVLYSEGAEIAFKIVTQGMLNRRTNEHREMKIYCLGWKDASGVTYMSALESGGVFMVRGEDNEWQLS